jgi:hypothetical protein
MEFEEMKRIWDLQNKETLYVINEKALHERIQSKKQQANHITNISELLSIIVNIGAGAFIFGINLSMQKGSLFMYLLSVWMFVCALFLFFGRMRRIKGNNQFDRSMQGDLRHAISMATYQVRLSQLMRWNILPIGALSMLGVWEGGKSVWIAIGILIFFVAAYYAGGWEHNIYKSKKQQLEILQNKLENELSI